MPGENSTYSQPQRKRIMPERGSENSKTKKLANKYLSLCNSMSESFCIVQFVTNDKEDYVDFIFREANPAFEEHTGLRNVVGKSARKIIPGELQQGLEYYRQLSAGHGHLEFLNFSETLGKWFEGSAFIFGEPEEHMVAIISNDITEKKKIEDELRESKKRYQSLIESNIDFIWEIDKYCRYSYCSPQIEKLWGYKPEDFIGKSAFDTLPPGEREKARELFEKAVISPTDFTQVESVSYNKQGEIIYVETSGTPSFNESGEILGFRGITRDITWRKKSEQEYVKNQQALNSSEAKFRSIVETANEGIGLVDKDLIVRYVNSKLCEIMEFSQDELIGKSAFEFLRRKDGNRLKRILVKINKLGKKDFEINLIKKNGSNVRVLVMTSLIHEGKGINRSYLAMITDISARVAAERDLKKTKKKLEIALDNGKIGTWEWNIKTDEVIWDRRMEEMFDLKPGTFGKKLSSFESLVHEEDIPHVKDAIRESLYNRKPYEIVYRTRPVNGKSHYISSKALLMCSGKGNPICLSGVAFDITDMKEGAEKVLIKLNEELLRSNADLRQFVLVASHDLQEPLRMIASYTQLLKQKYADKLDQDAVEYINFAVNGSKRMYEMINGLLAYSRINIRETDFSYVNMNTVLERVKSNLMILIDERNATILSEKLPVLFADENQMTVLLQNLIENSLKFSKTTPEIQISSELAGDNYIISVKDKGIGIEPQYFERIFRIFQKLHTKEDYRGAGIGLPICKRIIERHSGKIWVKSDQEGSTFCFSIPNK